GNFTLSYSGETTDALAHDSDELDIAIALGNLTTLEGSNVTVAIANCTIAESTCSWLVTFSSDLGDALPLLADASGLIGDGAQVEVSEAVKGSSA
ncbi:unnamed protein product, partial [Discosporangium mesarthrocarpum]